MLALPDRCPFVVTHPLKIDGASIFLRLSFSSSTWLCAENFDVLHGTGFDRVHIVANLGKVLLLLLKAFLSFLIGKGVHTGRAMYTLLFHQPIVLVCNLLHTVFAPAWSPVVRDRVEY